MADLCFCTYTPCLKPWVLCLQRLSRLRKYKGGLLKRYLQVFQWDSQADGKKSFKLADSQGSAPLHRCLTTTGPQFLRTVANISNVSLLYLPSSSSGTICLRLNMKTNLTFLHIHTRKRVNSKDGWMVAVGCHYLTLFDRHFMCRYWNRNGFDWTTPSIKPLKKIKLKMRSVCFSSLYFPPVHTVSPRRRAIIDVTYVCHQFHLLFLTHLHHA